MHILVDAHTFYSNKLEVYAEQQPQGAYFFQNDASSAMKHLIEPIDSIGHNVTTDNHLMFLLQTIYF